MRLRARSVVVGLLLLAAAEALLSTSVPAEGVPAAPRTVAAPRVELADPSALNDAINALQSRLSDDSYGGAFIDATARTITVVILVDPSADVTVAIRAAESQTGVSISTRPGVRSLADLKALQATVLQRLPSYLAATARSTKIDILDNSVQLGLEEPTEADRGAVEAMFGDAIEVVADAGASWGVTWH